MLSLPSIGRSEAFVHLFEWSWDDVAKECEEWLGPKGFAAVQVSPPQEHIVGDPWWTRYQPVSYNLTSRSGNESQFIEMVQRCKVAGVDIYVDAVINHGADLGHVGTAGSRFRKRHLPIYGPEHFHHFAYNLSDNCHVSDYSDTHNVQFCDLVGLPDLCTGCEYVQDTIAGYLSRLVEIGVAGIRIDAAKHIDPDELQAIFAKVKDGNRLFKFMEVSKADDGNDAVVEEAYTSMGSVTEFNYPVFLESHLAKKGRLFRLEEMANDLIPGRVAVVFVDNHDTQRALVKKASLTYKSGDLYKLAVAFMLAYPYGYPQLMSSFYFKDFDEAPPSSAVHSSSNSVACGDAHPWVCEHRWPSIANMVSFRRTAGRSKLTHFQALDEDKISFCRGSFACIAINRYTHEDWVVHLEVPLPSGVYCNVAVSDDARECPQIEVTSFGRATVKVPPMAFAAFHVNATVPSRVF